MWIRLHITNWHELNIADKKLMRSNAIGAISDRKLCFPFSCNKACTLAYWRLNDRNVADINQSCHLTARWQCRSVLISICKALSQRWVQTKLGYMDGKPHLSHIMLSPSQRWDQHQIVSFGDRGTWVSTTWTELLPGSRQAGSWTCDLTITRIQCHDHWGTKPAIKRCRLSNAYHVLI